MIKVEDLTLKYSNGKGIEEVSFFAEEGQVIGYLGPNGAGKTTTIRCLLGFSKSDSGSCYINNLDCYKDAPKIQKFLGYVPGEIAFIDNMTGEKFLNFMSDMRGTKGDTRMYELMEMFEFNAKGNIKKYSKGMKQKIGIIAAFMHDPQVIILDEPTSGLDPLMQNRFIDLVISEKKRGKTILMSSHIFEEVERTCDQIVIIKDGIIVERSSAKQLKENQRKSYILELENWENFDKLKNMDFEMGAILGNKREIFVKGNQIEFLINFLSKEKVITFETKNQSLEDIFLSLYSREGDSDEMDTIQSRFKK